MWFRRPPPTPGRSERWAAFAERLGAERAGDAAERLRRFLDLDDAEVRDVHVLRRPGAPALYLFDVVRRRSGPTGEVVRWSSWALVRGDRPISAVSFRAGPRRDAVLESLEASRTGAVRVDLAAWPEVDAALAVLARDPAAARALLTPAVTSVLRELVALGPGAAVVAAERHLLARVDVKPDADPADLAPLATGLLALAAALPAGGPPSIDEGDFLTLA